MTYYFRIAIQRHRMTHAERSKYAAVKAFWYDTEHAQPRSVVVGEGDPVFAIRHPHDTSALAYAAASATLERLQRGTATLSLTLLGEPEIHAEGRLRVTGMRYPIRGDWVVQRVEHQLDTHGFYTRCDADIPTHD